jgi:hypothetical protein
MLAEGAAEVAGLTADNLEWRATVVNVVDIPVQFAEVRLPSARFGDARLLVGQIDSTTIALVASDSSIHLALRELTEPDVDAWIQG